MQDSQVCQRSPGEQEISCTVVNPRATLFVRRAQERSLLREAESFVSAVMRQEDNQGEGPVTDEHLQVFHPAPAIKPVWENDI